MAGYAVAYLAKAGEIDKQSFLEERRHGVIQIAGLREIPEFLDNFRRIWRRREEVREQAKSGVDFALKG